jgi:anti-anti-sigma factor
VAEKLPTTTFSRPRQRVFVLAASGGCDSSVASELEEALIERAERGPGREILLDLGDLTHLDSCGIAAIRWTG